MSKIRWTSIEDSWLGIVARGPCYAVLHDDGEWWAMSDENWQVGPFADPADAMQIVELREMDVGLAMAGSKPGVGAAAGLWIVRGLTRAEEEVRVIIRALSRDLALGRFKQTYADRGPFAELWAERLTRAAG